MIQHLSDFNQKYFLFDNIMNMNIPVPTELDSVVEIDASLGILFDVDIFMDASAELVSP